MLSDELFWKIFVLDSKKVQRAVIDTYHMDHKPQMQYCSTISDDV